MQDVYQQFSSNNVRDLAWLLMSPEMFDEPLGDFPAFNMKLEANAAINWLHELDATQQHNGRPMPQRENFRRLGLYAESLLHYFFESSPSRSLCPFRLLAHNLQVFKGKNTLGELDLLLYDSDENFQHVELAVKYYLQLKPDVSAWNNWIGPNSIDRLDLKCDRMVKHQLSLSENYSFELCQAIQNSNGKLDSENLGEISPSTKIAASHLFKGMNFVHFRHTSNFCRPKQTNLLSTFGVWARLNEVKHHLDEISEFFGTRQSYLVDKMGWMTGDTHAETDALGDTIQGVEELFEQAIGRGYPTPGTMVFMVNEENIATKKELKTKKAPTQAPFANRLIIVGNEWPSNN